MSQAIGIRWSEVVDQGGRLHVRFWRHATLKKGRPRTTLHRPCRRGSTAAQGRPGGHIGRPLHDAQSHARRPAVAMGHQGDTSRFREGGVPHALRHTCATRLLLATGNIKLVQEWLGHRDIQTTSAVYAKVLAEQSLQGMSALEQFRLPAASNGTGDVPRQGSIAKAESNRTTDRRQLIFQSLRQSVLGQMVRKAGLEPARGHPHWNLNPGRHQFRHFRVAGTGVHCRRRRLESEGLHKAESTTLRAIAASRPAWRVRDPPAGRSLLLRYRAGAAPEPGSTAASTFRTSTPPSSVRRRATDARSPAHIHRTVRIALYVHRAGQDLPSAAGPAATAWRRRSGAPECALRPDHARQPARDHCPACRPPVPSTRRESTPCRAIE